MGAKGEALAKQFEGKVQEAAAVIGKLSARRSGRSRRAGAPEDPCS